MKKQFILTEYTDLRFRSVSVHGVYGQCDVLDSTTVSDRCQFDDGVQRNV